MGASIKAASAGGRKRRKSRHSPMSEINVTPFVDVMLVLLIIFMVAAPLMTGGVPLDLPQAKSSQLDNPNKEPVVVSIAKDGKIYLGQQDKDTIKIEELGAKLKAVMSARGGTGTDEPIFVRGDRTVDYGTVARVMARIKEAGYRKLSLVTETEGG
jgi:biopolymer transport protein TolR